MKLLIQNGRVIDPANGRDGRFDILITDGTITKVAESIADSADEIIDAAGKWVVPGLIDLHVHFREPGFTRKETIATGSRAAALGGFTTVCCMPNTKPVVDNEILVEYVKMKAEREAVVNVLPIGAITKGQNGEELADIGSMARAGACAVSEDGKSVDNAALMKTALKYAGMFNIPVLDHCEDKLLTGSGQMHAGAQAALMGLAGISPESEEVIMARDIILAKDAGAHLHICHISTAGAAQLLREAHARGEHITAEVCPHHFTLCDEDITDYDANFKMAPPLRSRADVAAMKEALADGTIAVIATDHAPHHIDEKNCEFAAAANGIVGLETAIALSITELVRAKVLTPMQLVEKLTLNPAKILGIGKGTLSEGADADIAIIDTETPYTVDVNTFASKSKNSPFHGREVYGKVTHTVCGGKVVVADGMLL